MSARIIISLVFLSLGSSLAIAQGNLEVKNLGIIAGKGAFTSGADIYSSLSDSTNTKKLYLRANHQRFFFIFGVNASKFHLGISGGAFEGMPWLGPYITFSPVKPFVLEYWTGFAAGNREEPAWRYNNYFTTYSGYLNFKHFGLSYVMMEFFEEWLALPGFEIKIPGKKSTLSLGFEYTTLVRDNDPLFKVGFDYTFK